MIWKTLFLAFILCSPYPKSPVNAADSIQDFRRPVQNATRFKGNLSKYLLNGLFVHTYESPEAYKGWSVLLENEQNLVLLEPQSMPNSASELHRYIGSLNKPLAGVVVAYHGVGPDSFPGTPIYATPEAITYIRSGEMVAALKQYAETFKNVDPKIVIPTNTITGPCFAVGDIDFCVQPADTARFPGPTAGPRLPSCNFSLPEHKIYFMHVLGGDTHLILKSLDEIDPYIEYLENVKKQGYEIFLSSHHMPETIQDVNAKIRYLERLKMVAAVAETSDEFISEIKRLEPTRKEEEYLRMTAENLYHVP